MVDLAVKGYLKIEETESKVLLFSHRDYTFHLLKPPDTWSSLEPHERVMLNHMFTGGATQVRLSDLKNQFYVAIPTMKSDILAELKSKGMYSVDPDSAHAYVLAGILFTAAPFVLAPGPGLGLDARFSGAADCRGNPSGDHRLPVRAHHDREIAEGRAHQGRDPRLPGVHQPRGRRPPEAHAARHLREISAVRHGAGHREPLGQGLPGNHPEPAHLVCGTDARMWASIPSSSPAPCTPWRWMRTRRSWPHRAPAVAARDGAVAVAEVEASVVAASAAAVAARSELAGSISSRWDTPESCWPRRSSGAPCLARNPSSRCGR